MFSLCVRKSCCLLLSLASLVAALLAMSPAASDLHRGTGDRADDFRRCRRLYHGALGYYDSLDCRLFSLGDVEEIWERLLPSVVRRYEQTLELEQRFLNGAGVFAFLEITTRRCNGRSTIRKLKSIWLVKS